MPTANDTPRRPAPVGHDFQLQRTFDAPRDLVFRAWTQSEHLAKWWGPAGLTMLRCEMDLRPGGVFLYGMKSPDGSEMWGKWVFRDVRAPERLEFLVSFCDPQGTPTRHPLAADWPMEVLSTVTFTEAAGKTTMAMTWTPWNATAHEQDVFAGATPSMEAGWGGTLANFEAYLATLRGAMNAHAASILAPEAADEILTTRRFAAPRALVFEAWTRPEHVDAWWGPIGFTIRTKEMRVATGGIWRFTMYGPDGIDYQNRVEFTEVVPGERLVYVHRDDAPGASASPPHFHVVVTFSDDGDGTLLAMRAKFPSTEARRHVVENFGAIEGGRQTLGRLDEFLRSRSTLAG